MRILKQAWFGWLIVALWMELIFFASTDLFSARHTSRFVEPFLYWLTGGHVTEETLQTVHFLIRKGCHLTEYAILALLARNAIWNSVSRNTSLPQQHDERSVSGLALLIAATYAAGDEFHQSFVPSRGASVHDVLIDTAGALIGLAVFRACRTLRRHSVDRYPHRDKS